ncbi:MAG: hypothetical protein LBR84_07370 [Tannerella sp.]|jgi:hypothetical protein|nr:hypothetical protein [Tannerella sp.]
MKKQLFFIATLLCILFSSCSVEKIAIAGSGWQEIAIVDKKTGAIEWKHQLADGEECNDIEVTPHGDILYAYGHGARLIKRDHSTIWDYKANEKEEIHTVSRLKKGGYLVGVCGDPARIVELDSKGNVTKEVKFRTMNFDIHNQFRHIEKNDSNIYLIPLMDKKKIMRVTPEGNYKGNLAVGFEAYMAKTLENKKLVISCGKDKLFLVLDPLRPQVDKTIYTREVKGASLRFVGEIHLCKNGNIYIANGNLQDDEISSSLLIEVDPLCNVVWSLPFNREIKNITSVYQFFE